MSDVNAMLDRAAAGEAQAAEELLPLVYDELRKLAAVRMASESDTSTLQPTALVHEAWLRLVGAEQDRSKNRAQIPRSRAGHGNIGTFGQAVLELRAGLALL